MPEIDTIDAICTLFFYSMILVGASDIKRQIRKDLVRDMEKAIKDRHKHLYQNGLDKSKEYRDLVQIIGELKQSDYENKFFGLSPHDQYNVAKLCEFYNIEI
jgi:hypothetical protein